MAKEKSEIDLLESINSKLDDLIAIMMIQGKEKEDQVRILVDNGFTSRNIGLILGIPKRTVEGIRARKIKKNK